MTDSKVGISRWVWGIAVIGLIVRLFSLDESLGWDELFMRSWVHGRSLDETLNFVTEKEKTPPFGFLLAWLVDHVDASPEVFRLPSLLAGVALIPLTGKLASKVWGRSAGTAAAALVAFSPFLAFYSVEARSYSLAAALTLASTLALIRGSSGGARWPWLLYGGLAALAITTHYIAAAVLFSQFVWVFFARPLARRPLLLAQIPMLALIAVLSPLLAEQFGHASEYLSRMEAVAPLTVNTVGKIVAQALIGQPFAYLNEVPGWVGIALVACGGLLALVFAAKRLQLPDGGFKEWLKTEKGLVAILACATPLMLVAVSLIPGQSILMTRNLIPSVPFLLTLAAAVLTASTGWRRVVPCVLVTSGLAIGLWISATSYSRPPFKSAAEAVMKRWQPGVPIVEVCCLAGQEGLPGVAIATYLPVRASFANFKVLTNGGAEEIAKARLNGRPFFLIWRDGMKGKMPSPVAQVGRGARPIWEEHWPGLFWVGAGEYR